jgi:hypothetical protein
VEFKPISDEVTAACCTDASTCEGGFPSACDEACAEVLLPMQRECAAVLDMIQMAETVAAAAVKCPAPAAPCTSYPEYMIYDQEVTAACCDDPSESCESGEPSTCGPGCATALAPMRRNCADFLSMIGLKDIIDAAAAKCNGKG